MIRSILVFLFLASLTCLSVYSVFADSASYGNGMINLGDGETSYSGAAGKVPTVKSTEDGWEWGTGGSGRPDSYNNVSSLAAAGGSIQQIFRPVSSYVRNGTTVMANLSSVWHFEDNHVTHVQEVTGAPGFNVEYVYTGVDTFNSVVMRALYTGLTGHVVNIQVWDYNANDWETYSVLDGTTDYTWKSPDIHSAVNHIQNGKVRVRIYHVSSGNATHHLYIDYAVLSSNNGAPSLGQYATKVSLNNETSIRAAADALKVDIGGRGVFSYMSTVGDAHVGGQVHVHGGAVIGGAVVTSGSVTAVGGIVGLATGAKRTIYVDFDLGNDANDGNSWLTAYKTWDKVNNEIPANILPFHNYSVAGRGTNTSAVTLSNRATASSGIYLFTDWTTVTSGTVVTTSNPTNYPDGTAKITDGSKTFGQYSGAGYYLSITSGTGSGFRGPIRLSNATTIYPCAKFATSPASGSGYAVVKPKWIQSGIGVTLSNLTNVSIDGMLIKGTSAGVAAITATNISGTLNGIYMQSCGLGVNFTSCPQVTINNSIAKQCAGLGFYALLSNFLPNYCTSVYNGGAIGGFQGNAGMMSPTGCDSRYNAMGYSYRNICGNNGVLSKCRALNNSTNDLQIEGNSVVKNAANSLFDGTSATGISVTTGGNLIFLTCTVQNHSGAGVGVRATNGATVTGTATVTYSNNGTNESPDPTSYGYID